MTKEKLTKLGFSEKEASVYLALLELGPAVVSGISKKAGVNRSTVYVILDLLKKRGLVTEEGTGAIKHYRPTEPEQLIKHLEETAARYKRMASSAHELLPELRSVEKRRKERKEEFIKPKVQFFEGHDGVQTVYEDTLASLENIRAYASIGDGKQTSALAKKSKIKVRVIFPNNSHVPAQMTRRKSEMQEVINAARGEKNFSSEINVYDDRVIFISKTEEYGLVIESKELADALKKAFNLSGKETKRFGKLSLAGEGI